MKEAVTAIKSAQQRFFDEITKMLPPNSIALYPGSGSDNTLEEFMRSTINIHLDKNVARSLPKNEVYGHYENLPFKNEVFDLIYISDSHATKEDFDNILLTLKTGGLVIFDTLFSCGPYQIDDIFENSKLNLVFSANTGVTNSYVFKKNSD